MHETTVVRHNDRTNIEVTRERLIGQRQIRKRFVDGDVHGDVGASAGVVRKDGVRHGGLVCRRVAGDGAVCKDKVAGKRRVDAPRVNKPTGVGHDDGAHIHVPRKRLVGEGQISQWLVDGDVHRDVGAPAAVVGENGVRDGRLIGIRTSSDGSVRKQKVAGQRRMNTPGLYEASGVGDDDRAHIHSTREGLVGEGQIGERLVHGDVHRDVCAPAGVVGKDGVRGGGLIGRRGAGDRAVVKRQVGRQGWMDPPRLNEATVVGHQHRTNVHAAGEDLIRENKVCQFFIDRDVHGDVGAATGIVSKNRVGGSGLVHVCRPRDGAVGKHQVAR